MIRVFYFRLKVVIKSSILRGVYFYVRKKIILNKVMSFVYPEEIVNIFQTTQNSVFGKYYANDKNRTKLLREADDFIAGKLTIYNTLISLRNYSLDSFSSNRQKKEIYNMDIRFHWEIYRFRFLINICIAYNISKNEKYLISIVNLIKSCHEYSPISNNDVVYNGMEASIKLINLSIIHSLLSDSDYYQKEGEKYLIKAAYMHSQYIWRNYDITVYGLESNHGLTCSVGLIYASQLFPHCRKSEQWYNFGIKSIKRALKIQFSSDGVNFESSVNYHRIVFELLIFLLASLYKRDVKVDIEIENGIKKIGEALLRLRHSNNLISRFGDNDGGKIFIGIHSNHNFNNLEYLNWFTNLRNNQYAETVLFEGISQFDKFLSINSQNGRIGNYLLYKNKDLSLIISGNEIGTLGKGNHQHNDFLSFELFSKNPFIVDPWSFCYTGDQKLRNLDRSTASHNNIIIDNRDIVVFDNNKLFEMLGNLKVKIDKFEETHENIDFLLSHNGYNSLKNGGQLHIRGIKIIKAQNTIIITDKLVGTGNHTADLFFHVPKIYWSLKKNVKQLIFYNDQEKFCINWENENPVIGTGFVSHNFLNRSESFLIHINKEYSDNMTLKTFISYKKY